MNSFFRAICQMGIFMICAQAIIHFRPNGSYEKYLKMLVSTMILVQVFLPVSRLFTSGTQEGLEERIAMMEEQIKRSMEEAQKTAVITDEMLNKMTLEEVKTRLYNAEKSKDQQKDADIEKISATGDDISIEAGKDSQNEQIMQEMKEDHTREAERQQSQSTDEDKMPLNKDAQPALGNEETSEPQNNGDRKIQSEDNPGIGVDRIEVRVGGENQED